MNNSTLNDQSMAQLKSFVVIIILIVISSCLPQPRAHSIKITEDVIEVHFGRAMSKALLDSIREVVALEGVSLSYPVVKYDGDLLSELQFDVYCMGQGGSATTRFAYKGKAFGFRINRKIPGGPGIQIGDLTPEKE